MSKIEKIVAIVVSILGAFGGLAGLWGAYSAYDAAKFKEPYVKHEELVKSFLSQIGSAENRKDDQEANRVRVKYERFEESWRDNQRLAAIVAPIGNLAAVELSDSQLKEVGGLLASVQSEQPASEESPRVLGSAYFALGEFDQALKAYQTAANISPKDPDIFALKAATYAQLSEQGGTKKEQDRNKSLAIISLKKAASLSANHDKLSEYLLSNSNLREVVASDPGISTTMIHEQ